MRVTDEALETIARAVTERDIRIAELQQQLDDLRGEPPQQRERRPSGAWPAVADAGDEGAKEAGGAEGAEQTGPAGSGWPFADRGALSADPETTRPEAFTARPGDGSSETTPPEAFTARPGDGSSETTRPEAFTARPGDGSSEGTGEEPADQDTTCGMGQPAARGRPASAPVWSGASRDDLPHNTGEPTNPDLVQQSPVWAAAGQQHEAGPQQAGYGESLAPAPGAAPAEAGRPGPPWAKVTSPWDEPDGAGAEPFVWDDSHQTLVWGAEHQRAKASRLQEQDEASKAGQGESDPGQATAEPGQARVEQGQATAEPGQAAVEPGQDEPETGQAAAEPGQATAEPGQDEPETGQAAVEPGQAAAEPGQDEPETGQAAVEPGQATAEPGQATAEPGQATAEPGQATAEPGQDAAERGQDAADSDGERSLAHSEQDRG